LLGRFHLYGLWPVFWIEVMWCSKLKYFFWMIYWCILQLLLFLEWFFSTICIKKGTRLAKGMKRDLHNYKNEDLKEYDRSVLCSNHIYDIMHNNYLSLTLHYWTRLQFTNISGMYSSKPWILCVFCCSNFKTGNGHSWFTLT